MLKKRYFIIGTSSVYRLAQCARLAESQASNLRGRILDLCSVSQVAKKCLLIDKELAQHYYKTKTLTPGVFKALVALSPN